MQLRVDPLRQLTRNAFDGRNVVNGGSSQPSHAAEAHQQALAPLARDGDLIMLLGAGDIGHVAPEIAAAGRLEAAP